MESGREYVLNHISKQGSDSFNIVNKISIPKIFIYISLPMLLLYLPLKFFQHQHQPSKMKKCDLFTYIPRLVRVLESKSEANKANLIKMRSAAVRICRYVLSHMFFIQFCSNLIFLLLLFSML